MEYVSKMEFYLTSLDVLIKEKSENPCQLVLSFIKKKTYYCGVCNKKQQKADCRSKLSHNFNFTEETAERST